MAPDMTAGKPVVTQRFYAHSGHRTDRSDWQTLDHHEFNVAALAQARGEFLGIAKTARIAGQLHDFGKYDPAFDTVLCGQGTAVDHSTAGGWLALERASPANRHAAEVLAYTILGHHAGLPDMQTSANSCLQSRISRFRNPIAPEIIASTAFDLGPVVRELVAKMPGPSPAFNLALATRMAFSCLVDADFRDTEAFYAELDGSTRDRQWPSLDEVLPDMHAALAAKLSGFPVRSALNDLRRSILDHVRSKATLPPGLFTLTVPTGGGKTLASMAFALDHARVHGQRRIIYAIPYSSITQQTAETFRELFGDVVLEHHASIDDAAVNKGQRDKLRLAMEDWAAPVVVTTNVQLFESLFGARSSRCRKLHNIAGSVIILDEAQCLPRGLLIPTLRMIEALCRHWGCTIVLCTATQPAFDSRQLKTAGLPLEGRELAPDPDDLARRLRRAQILQGGVMSDDDLVTALGAVEQGMVIVNSRAHALSLYQSAAASALSGVVHLTTRQYPAHRRAILADIKHRLRSGQPCRLIATSLIEAGVDLDFPRGWRAEAGLDSIVQAAGRVNREGTRDLANSTLTVFVPAERKAPPDIDRLAKAMRKIAPRHADLLMPEAIRDWFHEVYWTASDGLDAKGIMERMILANTGTNFAFRDIADLYRMVETTMVPVIIPADETAQSAISALHSEQVPSGAIARILQDYVVQVPEASRSALIANGHAEFIRPDLRADQFCVLSSTALYHSEAGLIWEDAHSLAETIL